MELLNSTRGNLAQNINQTAKADNVVSGRCLFSVS